MSNNHAGTSNQDHHGEEEIQIRDIHALTPPRPPSANPSRPRELWENISHRSSTLSTTSSENFTSMSREFNALVLAGATVENVVNNDSEGTSGANNILARIGEDDHEVGEDSNPLAIVTDNSPLEVSRSPPVHGVSVQRVKKEEVETKITAWQTAKIAKVNNRFKREDAVINGWESEEVQKATSWMKKIERKLEEKRAKALEKMQNDIAKARRKAAERRASAEAKRGTKVARVLEIANLMRAVGRPPVKRSFF